MLQSHVKQRDAGNLIELLLRPPLGVEHAPQPLVALGLRPRLVGRHGKLQGANLGPNAGLDRLPPCLLRILIVPICCMRT